MNVDFFVKNVKYYCRAKGLSPSRACIESGAGKSLVDNIKRGRVPSVDSVQLLAQYLGVTVSELLGETLPEKQTRAGLTEQLTKAARDRIETADERKLLEDYRSLNPQGQEYIRQTMHMAAQIYKKSPGLPRLEDQA